MIEERELVERLVRLEDVQAEILALTKEARDTDQKVAALVESLGHLDRRMAIIDQSVQTQWRRVDPLVHSDPPLTRRVLENERGLAELRGIVTSLGEHVTDMRDTARKLTYTTVVFVLLGVLNAVVQFTPAGVS